MGTLIFKSLQLRHLIYHQKIWVKISTRAPSLHLNPSPSQFWTGDLQVGTRPRWPRNSQSFGIPTTRASEKKSRWGIQFTVKQIKEIFFSKINCFSIFFVKKRLFEIPAQRNGCHPLFRTHNKALSFILSFSPFFGQFCSRWAWFAQTTQLGNFLY